MARELIAEFGLPLRPGDKVRDLSVAMQQMVEIMKAYSRRPKVLAFDEPTACLSDKEAQVLFTLIDRLREKGLIVIYVSHRMNEIFRLASKIVVLKDGEFIAEHRAADTDENRLVSEMVGRPVGGMFSGLVRAEPSGEEILRVRGLTGRGFADVGFSLRRGEILGFFGLVGAGRTEVMLALFGAVPAEAGEIELRGKPCRIRRTRDAIDQKIAYCPEDRKQQGILPLRPVRDNISVVVLRGLCRGPFISSRRENAFARDYVEEFRIKTSSIEKPIYQLSGGNQQKALLARWLLRQAGDPHPRRADQGHRRGGEGGDLPDDLRRRGAGGGGDPRLLRAARDHRPERPHRRDAQPAGGRGARRAHRHRGAGAAVRNAG